jgi:hypothetical protein
MLHPSLKQTFFAKQVDRFGFNGTKEYLIYNPFEGQIIYRQYDASFKKMLILKIF